MLSRCLVPAAADGASERVQIMVDVLVLCRQFEQGAYIQGCIAQGAFPEMSSSEGLNVPPDTITIS